MADQIFSKPFAFTVTVYPTCYGEPPASQYDKLTNHLMQILESLTPLERFSVIAETTKGYNIHYHGSIQFPVERKQNGDLRNPLGKFYDAFRGPTMRKTRTKNEKVFGYVMIKEIEQEEGWIVYLTKGLKTFKEDIERKPIIHDGLNIFSTMDWLLYGRHGDDFYE